MFSYEQRTDLNRGTCWHGTLSTGSLNARSWVPRKDYTVNRLRSGPLQLAPGTALILDETALSTVGH